MADFKHVDMPFEEIQKALPKDLWRKFAKLKKQPS